MIKEVPHWQCTCSIEIFWPEKFNEIVREYSVLVPLEEGSYEVARDLSFIYTAYYGLGVGKKSRDLFEGANQVELQVCDPKEQIESNLKELTILKRKLGVTSLSELDPFVQEWDPDLASYMDVNRTNLRGFVTFLQSKVADGARQPDQTE